MENTPPAPQTTQVPPRRFPYRPATPTAPRPQASSPVATPNEGQVVVDGTTFRKEVVANAEERLAKLLEYGGKDEKNKERLRHAVATAFPTADEKFIDKEVATVLKCAEMTLGNKGNTASEMVSWLALMAAKPESVWGEIVKIAQMGLRPDHITKEAWLTPKTSHGQTVCVGIPGVRGLEKILARSGKLDSISGRVIRVGDIFEFVDGTEPKIVHKPALRKEAVQPVKAEYGTQTSSAVNIQNTITGAWVCIRMKGCSTPEISVREYTPPAKRKFMTLEADALFSAKREAMRNAIRHHCVDSQSAALALAQIAESEKLAEEVFEATVGDAKTRTTAQRPVVEFVAPTEANPKPGTSVDEVISETLTGGRRR